MGQLHHDDTPSPMTSRPPYDVIHGDCGHSLTKDQVISIDDGDRGKWSMFPTARRTISNVIMSNRLYGAWRLSGRWPDGGLSERYGPGVCLGDGQTEAYLKDVGVTGLAFAWAKARQRP